MNRVLLAVASLAAAFASTGAAVAAPAEPSTASCIRGRWYAPQAEAHRVLQALAPGPYRVSGQLFIVFDGRLMLYGTTAMRLTQDLGGSSLIADASFETQAPYAVRRPGRVILESGTSVISYGDFTAVKAGRRVSVPGPPDRETVVPGGPWPYQCTSARLKLKLPTFASSGWITFQKRR